MSEDEATSTPSTELNTLQVSTPGLNTRFRGEPAALGAALEAWCAGGPLICVADDGAIVHYGHATVGIAVLMSDAHIAKQEEAAREQQLRERIAGVANQGVRQR